jgi:hypothetical protein
VLGRGEWSALRFGRLCLVPSGLDAEQTLERRGEDIFPPGIGSRPADHYTD